MPAISFTDEELDSLASLATVLQPSDRDAFLQAVAGKLAACPPENRGPGLVHRLGVEAQRGFLRTDQVAIGVGGKYGRVTEGRREGRRRDSST